MPGQPSRSPGAAASDAPVATCAPVAPAALAPRPDASRTGGQLVLAACVVLVAAQLGFRAWALYPSWFYTDDYRLLHDADRPVPDWGYLTQPFDNQLMPLGRLVAWVVADSGRVQWGLAATTTLFVQLLASLACVWALVALFGPRRRILGLLALYLTSALTLPATMWWAASLNQLPLQAVLFGATAAWATYLRTSRRRWLALTAALLVVGFLAYVKTILVVALLAWLLLGWFVTGAPLARLRSAVRAEWLSAVVVGGTTTAFLLYYAATVPSIFAGASWSLAGELADTMLGTSLTTGLLGGPWRWDTSNPPVGYADPPAWAVHVSWVVLALLVLALALRRERTGRAWALLAVYAAGAYALLLTSRAPVAGAAIGLELRYLTDVLPVAVLCVGLAALPVRGAVETSRRRERPLLTAVPGRRWQAALVGAVCVSGALSSATYARIWHTDNPGDDWAHAVQAGLAGLGPVDLADQVVPADVVPGFSYPANTVGRLAPLLVDNARFPTVTDRLVVLDTGGEPRRALIDPVALGQEGPREGCGWPVREGAPRTVPLVRPTADYTWWVRVGYLSSAADTVTVEVGDRTVEAPVDAGLGSLFVEVTSAVSSVTLDGLSPGTTMCVDVVEVGTAVAGGPL